jgi:hypothetical protein
MNKEERKKWAIDAIETYLEFNHADAVYELIDIADKYDKLVEKIKAEKEKAINEKFNSIKNNDMFEFDIATGKYTLCDDLLEEVEHE